VPADKITFSGVGKTEREMLWRSTRTSCASTSNPSGTAAIVALAAGRNAVARIALRVNPDVDAGTHAKISTASRRTSSASRSRRRARSMPSGLAAGIEVTGVDMHIGSQIIDLRPFDAAFALLADFVRQLRADQHRIDHVDLGGGLGIPYRDDNEPPPHPDR